MSKQQRRQRGQKLSTAEVDARQQAGVRVQRVNVDLPLDILRAVDAEALRIGITRQSFIKLRIADALSAARQETR